jgi:hypothetical protein
MGWVLMSERDLNRLEVPALSGWAYRGAYGSRRCRRAKFKTEP